jgi:hypothetical protein
MKYAIALTVTLLLASSGVALAQQPSQTASLADVARAEEARRKTAKKATRMLTNSSLTAGDAAGTPATPAASGAVPATPGTVPATPGAPDDEERPAQAPGEKRDQAYWSKRISQARAELSRSQMFAESMQTRVNVLSADIVNLDYPARGVAEQQRNKALAELERLKKEIDQKTKEIASIEDEARRANVPSGWLRP